MIHWFFWLIFAGYFTSWLFYFAYFESEKEVFFFLGRRLLTLNLFFHFAFLVYFLSQKSMDTALFFEFSIPFIILLLSFFMEWRYRAKFLVLFSLPIVLLISMLAASQSWRYSTDAWAQRVWLWIHFGFILAGLAGFVAAVSSAIMYLWQNSQLKSKHPGQNFLKLPSLDTLDKIHFTSLAWGVILFSLGILTGVIWATGLKELGALFRDPKVILSFITCAMYWVIVSLRGSSFRRGHKIAAGTLVVFLLVFLTIASAHYVPSAFPRGL